MRILNDEDDSALSRAWVYLTRAEAQMVFESLNELFADEEPNDEWHAHIESSDGRKKELTLALYDPNDPGLDTRWKRFFNDDIWEPAPRGDDEARG